MKSVLVTTEMFTVGGLETHLCGEVAELSRLGCEVHLAVGQQYSDLMLPKQLASLTTGLAFGPDATMDDLVESVEKLRQLIRNYKVECIHAHPFVSLIASCIAAELEGIAFAVTLHGPVSLRNSYGPVYEFLIRSIILPQTGLVVVVSDEIARLSEPYVAPGTLVMLPNSITPSVHVDSDAKTVDPRWLVVSRLDAAKCKGILDFIEKAYVIGIPGIRIAGDGPAMQNLQGDLLETGLLDFVELLGVRTDIRALMRTSAGVGGMGRVVLEGLSEHRPVVLIGYDGVKGVVNQELFLHAKLANFSGRNLPTVKTVVLERQFKDAASMNNCDLNDFILKDFSEDCNWRVFLKRLQDLPAMKRSVLGDVYLAMRSADITDSISFLQSEWTLNYLLDVAHGTAHFEPRLISSLQVYKEKYLHEVSSKRDGQIAGLHQALTERDADVQRLAQQIVAQDARAQELAREVAQQVSVLTQQVGDRESRIAGLVQTIGERDQRIETLTEAAVEQSRQVSVLAQQVEDRESRIAALVQTIGERDQRIETLTEAAVEQSRQVSVLTQQVGEGQRAAERLRREILQLSDWADRMNSRPAAYALKKYLFHLARRTLRILPATPAQKRRMRDSVLSLARPFRANLSYTSCQAPMLDSVPSAQPFDRIACSTQRDVFVFSVIDWHFRIQRPQHLARSFANTGRRVFFFSNHFVDESEPGYQIEQLDPSLALYQIRLHVQGAPAIYFAPPTSAANSMLQASIAKLILDFGAISTISLVQHAYWYPLARRLSNTYRIYDCMDHHEGFGNVPEKLIEIERYMLKRADLVVVTSSWLETFARDHNSSVALIRNAGEYEHFADRPREVYVDPQCRRIIGYYGAIAEWFDLDLIRAVALRNTDCLILLVGNDTVDAGTVLGDLPNVAFTGEVPYARLPFYLHAFDVCLLPFKVIPLTLATNPVKIYEYLAAGKPVVSVDLPEIGQFGDLVWRAQSTDEFVQKAALAMEPRSASPAMESARKAFAAEQTWDHRIAELDDALNDLRMPRISVIVLTYNNLELTRACLSSLIERTGYPNLEIVVVDNASIDDTRAYLDEFGRRHAHVKVILNESNVGFAAGNNVGLAAATGDYLVILNNDTVVTPGWAMTLLRHLQADASIGLVGPVTNNIGNEARIETAYEDLADMPAEALRFTLDNMGKTFPMRSAAFFCVMMPRSTYEICGPLCEDYGRGFFEDDDYCRRVEAAGLRIVCSDDVFIHHHLSASFNKLKSAEKQELFERNKAIYEQKWGNWTPHAYRDTYAIS